MSEDDYESKAQFIEAVRDGGAVLGDNEYFTEGEGRSTSYKLRTNDGEVDDISKSDVEDAWEEAQVVADEDDTSDEEEDEQGDRSAEVHLGTLYYSQRNWDDDQHRADLEAALTELGWSITGEVESGGYRIGTVE